MAEILETLGRSVKTEVFEKKIKGYWPNRQDWNASGKPIIRGTLLGFTMGIFPGVSPMIPTFLSYGIEKRLSKNPEQFGNGKIEGVAAPEACNNAAAQASFIPLLGLGIPSNAFNAILLGSLMIYGYQPGPLLIKSHPDFFWGVVSSMYIGNAMLVVLNLPLIPIWIKVLQIPYTLLSVLILIFCLIGAYSINNNMNDAMITFIFGAFGLLSRKFRLESPPLILAFVLGPLVESAFRQSMIISGGSFGIFVTRPISLFFVLVTLGIIGAAFIKKRKFAAGMDRDE